jgi:mannose-6-phosphate isomerase
MPGILLNEIQQNSDITYRVYDWGRTDKNGKSRQLHLRQSLETIDFSDVSCGPEQPKKIDDRRWLLTRNEFFTTEKWIFEKIDASTRAEPGPGCRVLSVIFGKGVLSWDGGEVGVSPGDSLVVPWSTGDYRLVSREGPLTILNSYI